MTAYAAMLRAVNLGGGTTLPMAQLKAIGEACGFSNVATFIASGNLLFDCDLDAGQVTVSVESGVAHYFGRHVPVYVRTGAEMAAVAAANPFADRPPNRVVAHFMAEPPSPAMIDAATGLKDERLALGAREIYIAYGDDMGHSKLRLPAFRDGTARNMNSVAKMSALLA
ncbi:MAG: DUF1697 domain-containing protein [Sphingomicrobium sp.]